MLQCQSLVLSLSLSLYPLSFAKETPQKKIAVSDAGEDEAREKAEGELLKEAEATAVCVNDLSHQPQPTSEPASVHHQACIHTYIRTYIYDLSHQPQPKRKLASVHHQACIHTYMYLYL
jgi:hypothetical protein